MKKILYILLLVGLFFVASLMEVRALNGSIHGIQFRYINNNVVEDKFTNWQYIQSVENSGSIYDLVGNGYHGVFIGSVNKNINHYIFPNKYNIRFYTNDDTFTCNNASTITFRLQAFALDDNGNYSQYFSTEDFWKNAEMYITANNQHDDSFQCSTSSWPYGEVMVTCPVPSASYTNLHIHINSEPFKNLSWDDDLAHDLTYYLSIDEDITYECLAHPFLDVYTSVSGSSATVSVESTETDVTGYYFQLFDVDETEQLSFENTYTWNNLSNGTYKGQVIATYADGTRGTLTQFSFEVTESPLPKADFSVSILQNNADELPSLGIDASSSTSETPILTYYYRLDNGQWYSSDNSVFIFQDVSYGNHKVSVMVENESGRSSVFSKNIDVLSPYEEEKNFWESVLSFFSDFFTNFIDTLFGFFVPDETVLSAFISELQTTFETKLGFLGDSINFIIDEFQFLIAEPTGFTGICLDPLEMPAMGGVPSYDIIATETCLDSSVMDNFSALTDVIKVVVTFTFLGWFATFAYKELHSILNGGGQ